MSVGDYLIGVAFAMVVWGGAAAVAEIVVRRRLAAVRGAPRVLARVLLGLSALIGAHLLPGSVGLLSREAVALVVLGATLAAWRLVPGSRAPGAPRGEAPNLGGRTSAALAAIAAAVVTVLALASFASLAPDPPGHVDALSFGLPGVAEWIRTGSLLEVGAFFPLFEVRTYPNNGDVVYLATVLPFGNDSFVRFPALPLLAATAVGVYGVGRELGAAAAPAALAATLVLAVPAVGEPALEDIKPDVFMYATFAAGLLFLLRHSRTGDRADLLLAGAGLGLAFGARWYGISSVVAVVFVWAVARLVARHGVRPLARHLAVVTGLVLVAGGYWLLRNALLTGNPVYPVDVSPFGVTIFGAPPDVFAEGLGASLVDRIGLPGLFADYVLPEYRARLAAPAAVLGLATLLTLGVGLRALRRGHARRQAPAALTFAVGALVLAAVYTITPASAQGFDDAPLPGFIGANSRWLVPALIAAAGPAAWLMSGGGRCAAAGQGVAFVAVLSGAYKAYGAQAAHVVLVTVGLCAFAAVGWLAVRQAQPGARKVPRSLLGMGAALLASMALVVGYLDQARFNDRRFAGVSAVSDWIRAHAPSDHRVGFAGGWQAGYVPIYSAFGPTFENSVEYVGSLATGSVRRYRRPTSFRRALRDGGYDLLVVGRTAFPKLDRARPLRTYEDPPEARWARAAGFREVAREDQFVLLASGSRAAGLP